MSRHARGTSAPPSGWALRIDTSVARGAVVTVRVDGEPVRVHAGESVAAVLLAGGWLAMRRSARRREPRGYYCGMGVCHECLVRVDGLAHVRACTTEVAEGMRIETGSRQRA